MQRLIISNSPIVIKIIQYLDKAEPADFPDTDVAQTAATSSNSPTHAVAVADIPTSSNNASRVATTENRFLSTLISWLNKTASAKRTVEVDYLAPITLASNSITVTTLRELQHRYDTILLYQNFIRTNRANAETQTNVYDPRLLIVRIIGACLINLATATNPSAFAKSVSHLDQFIRFIGADEEIFDAVNEAGIYHSFRTVINDFNGILPTAMTEKKKQKKMRAHLTHLHSLIALIQKKSATTAKNIHTKFNKLGLNLDDAYELFEESLRAKSKINDPSITFERVISIFRELEIEYGKMLEINQRLPSIIKLSKPVALTQIIPELQMLLTQLKQINLNLRQLQIHLALELKQISLASSSKEFRRAFIQHVFSYLSFEVNNSIDSAIYLLFQLKTASSIFSEDLSRQDVAIIRSTKMLAESIHPATDENLLRPIVYRYDGYEQLLTELAKTITEQEVKENWQKIPDIIKQNFVGSNPETAARNDELIKENARLQLRNANKRTRQQILNTVIELTAMFHHFIDKYKQLPRPGLFCARGTPDKPVAKYVADEWQRMKADIYEQIIKAEEIPYTMNEAIILVRDKLHILMHRLRDKPGKFEPRSLKTFILAYYQLVLQILEQPGTKQSEEEAFNRHYTNHLATLDTTEIRDAYIALLNSLGPNNIPPASNSDEEGYMPRRINNPGSQNKYINLTTLRL